MDKTELFSLFGGRKKFFEKVGIYLRQITRGSVRFRFEGFSRDDDGYLFALFKIWSPIEYRKGVKVQSLLSFFDMDDVGGVAVEKSEADQREAEDVGGRSPDRPTAPVAISVGGGSGE